MATNHLTFRDRFIHKDNISHVFGKILAALPSVTHDRSFNETVLGIANTILQAEQPKLETRPPEQALELFNTLVSSEAIKYFSRRNGSKKHPPESIVIQATTRRSQLVLTSEETLVDMSGVFDLGVSQVVMHHADFLITENNCILIVSHTTTHDSKDYHKECKVEIEPGNYTESGLLDALTLESRKATNDETYHFSQNPLNGKTIVSMKTPNTTFSIEHTGLLGILGFEGKAKSIASVKSGTVAQAAGMPKELVQTTESEHPLKLIKTCLVDVTLDFYSQTTCVFQMRSHGFIDPNVPDPKHIVLHEEHRKDIKDSDTLAFDKILVGFDGYNHRNFPYYIVLDIAYKSV